MNGRKAKEQRRNREVVQFELEQDDAEWLVGWLDALMSSISPQETNGDVVRLGIIGQRLIRQYNEQKSNLPETESPEGADGEQPS